MNELNFYLEIHMKTVRICLVQIKSVLANIVFFIQQRFQAAFFSLPVSFSGVRITGFVLLSAIIRLMRLHEQPILQFRSFAVNRISLYCTVSELTRIVRNKFAVVRINPICCGDRKK